MIEPLRKETKEIGSSSEAAVEYCDDDKEKEVISSIEDIASVLIVSSFKLSNENRVYHHKGERCDRCWNYFNQLYLADEKHVCKRCRKAISENL